MGSFINICNPDTKDFKNINGIEVIKEKIDLKDLDSSIIKIKKLYLYSYFIKLKNYNKTSEDNNEKLQENKNSMKEDCKKGEKNKEDKNDSKNENRNINNKPNSDSLLNSTMNIKLLNNNNDDNNIVNETTMNIRNNSPDKVKEKNNDGNTPGDQNTTPMGNYDKNLIPGKMLFLNINDSELSEQIVKREKDLGEFIIEQKELIKYMEQYPYIPKSFYIQYDSGEKYSGYFSPSWEKEIFGIQLNPNGSKYVGLFKNGMYDGRGRIIFSKGDYFEGEFKNNKANGFGKYVNINGEIYIGNWLNDKQDGQGELILKNGSRYTGEFKNGMENGKGKIIWPDSSFYEGDFVNNYFDGYGIYVMRNKKNYIGQWKMGQMNGFGIFNYPDGKSFKGYFEKDKKNGFGIYSGKNNLRYEGGYKKGRQYGIGRIINEKGEIQLGLYLKGKRLKILNEKDFKEDIAKIDKEIEKINNIIKNNEFFVKNIEQLTIIQKEYFGTTQC